VEKTAFTLDFVADRRSLPLHIGLFVLRSAVMGKGMIGVDLTTGLFIVIVGAAVILIAASSSRNRRPTPRTSWILLAVVIAIVAALGVILANRHGG
jgi:hypothetical protein